MTEAGVVIRLDGNRRVYEPGENLSGEYHVESMSVVEPKAVEVSVVWYTEGKGDEDLVVHFFERTGGEDGRLLDLRRPRKFAVPLPHSPLSYDGVIVKIRWSARVRLFLPKGKEVFAEAPFQLGKVPSAQRVPPPEP